MISTEAVTLGDHGAFVLVDVQLTGNLPLSVLRTPETARGIDGNKPCQCVPRLFQLKHLRVHCLPANPMLQN